MNSDFRIDFIIIGAQKCGTTYLSNLLANHPEVCFSRVKEPFHFNRIASWDENIIEYHELFSPARGQICGEASTHYTFLPRYPNTAQRIYEYNPDIKLIYLMRNPFERLLSLYTFKRIRHETNRSFEEAIFYNPEYISVGRYYTQLLPYLNLFPREQILTLVFETFISHTDAVIREVGKFLHIDANAFPLESEHTTNKSAGIRYPNSFLSNIKQLLQLRYLKGLLPDTVVDSLKDYLYDAAEKPTYSPQLRKEISHLFALDIKALESEIYERGISEWKYDGKD